MVFVVDRLGRGPRSDCATRFGRVVFIGDIGRALPFRKAAPTTVRTVVGGIECPALGQDDVICISIAGRIHLYRTARVDDRLVEPIVAPPWVVDIDTIVTRGIGIRDPVHVRTCRIIYRG